MVPPPDAPLALDSASPLVVGTVDAVDAVDAVDTDDAAPPVLAVSDSPVLAPAELVPSVTVPPHPDNETIPRITMVGRANMSISALTLPVLGARWQAPRENRLTAVPCARIVPAMPRPSAFALLAFLLACGEAKVETAGSSDTVTDATTDAPTGGTTSLDCKSYCTAITANCTGPDAQYASIQQCQTTCPAFPFGDEADRDGNTLGCRVYHTDAAAADPAMHCTHAGPGGAGQCGSNCEGFCAVAALACPGTFPDGEMCASACAGYADSEPFDAGDVAGDTLACRLYHATVATEAPAIHCAHILPDSATCGGA